MLVLEANMLLHMIKNTISVQSKGEPATENSLVTTALPPNQQELA
jgi:hypothetical protein